MSHTAASSKYMHTKLNRATNKTRPVVFNKQSIALMDLLTDTAVCIADVRDVYMC